MATDSWRRATYLTAWVIQALKKHGAVVGPVSPALQRRIATQVEMRLLALRRGQPVDKIASEGEPGERR